MNRADISLIEANLRAHLPGGFETSNPDTMLARIVETVQKREAGTVAFYGCGTLAENLVKQYRKPLKDSRVVFVTSFAGQPSEFHGFPWRGLDWLRQRPPQTVILLSLEYEVDMRRNLEGFPGRVLGLGDLAGMKDDYRFESLETFLAEKYKDVLEDLARMPKDKPLLLITSQSFCHNHLSLMFHLSRHFRVLVLVNDERLNRTVRLSNYVGQGYFDRLYVNPDWNGYLEELMALCRLAPLWGVHYLALAGNPLPGAVAALHSRAPVFVEFCDFKEIMYDHCREGLRSMAQSNSQLALEEQCHRAVFVGAAGIVIKDDPQIISALAEKHGFTPRWLQFNYYPSTIYSPYRSKTRKLSEETGKTHIVYVGSLHNDPSSHCYPIHRSIYRAAQSLTKRGFHFTVYNGMDTTGQGYEDYLKLARENPLFDYRFAVPQEGLAKILTPYDLAWFVHDYSQAVESSFFIETNFPSRLFYYLGAGLPVVVGANQPFVRSFVEKQGIGLSVNFDDIDRLPCMLASVDWEEMHRCVERTQMEYSMPRQLPRLLAFYEESRNRSPRL